MYIKVMLTVRRRKKDENGFNEKNETPKKETFIYKKKFLFFHEQKRSVRNY